MELRKFIATTIREYLNEHEEFNDSLNLSESKNYVELVRIILSKSFDNIDLNNLGNHFTVVGNEYAITSNIETLSDDAMKISEDSEMFFIYVRTTKEAINWEATKISNEEYPHEKEVITNVNTPIFITQIYNEDHEIVVENVWGNTGNRVDLWVNNK